MDEAAFLATISLLDLGEHLTTVLWGFVFLWLFWFGGSVGSFMNVVVYRLPAGLNLVHPGSRCPKCLHPIRWYHNLPILGWLLLRGKCRDCKAPISARYPTVEAFVASLFVCLAAVEVASDGANLPALAKPIVVAGQKAPARVAMGRSLPQRPRHPLADTPERLWGMYAFQLLLACTLLCAALIEYDGQTSPARLFLPALVVGVIAPLFWPQIRAVPLSPEFAAAPWARGLAEGSAGLFVGALLGGIMAAILAGLQKEQPLECHCLEDAANNSTLTSDSTGVRKTVPATTASPLPNSLHGSSTRSPAAFKQWHLVAAPAAVGLFLGWQAATLIATAATIMFAACSLLAHVAVPLRRWGFAVCLTAVTLIVLFTWGPVVARVPWFGPSAGPSAIGLSLMTVTLAALIVSRFAPIIQSPTTQGETRVANSAENLRAILTSPTYRLAEADSEFLARPELRPVRMQLELLKPQMALEEHGIKSTIVAFGGTSIVERAEAEKRLDAARLALAASPDDAGLRRGVNRAESILAKSHYYDEAREFGRLVSSSCQVNGQCDYVIVTGGGPGIMEAANRGAFDAGAKSIGLNITLPAEQAPNPYITPELCFQFHYFALRKMHFLMRAKALVVFPGGFGTLDELTDALTLRQTQRMQAIPIIMYGSEYWRHVIDFQFLADEGVIADEHLKLIDFADTPEEAWQIIATYHNHR